jgi:hypothetical protein
MPRNRVGGPGSYNAICAVCGFKFKASELIRRWDGLLVDKACWEPRHPQEFIRAKHDEKPLPFTRPDVESELTYSPTWGLINAAGNATITGGYGLYTESDGDQIVNVHVRATMGSSTTYTAGAWTITVPVTNGALEVTGSASAFLGQRWVQGFAILPASSSTVTIRSENQDQWSDTVPFTWVADARFSLSIRYGTDT